jgi:hypothetical protein
LLGRRKKTGEDIIEVPCQRMMRIIIDIVKNVVTLVTKKYEQIQ